MAATWGHLDSREIVLSLLLSLHLPCQENFSNNLGGLLELIEDLLNHTSFSSLHFRHLQFPKQPMRDESGELNLRLDSLMVKQDSPLKLINKRNHRRISRIEQENLLRRDNRLYVLQIDNNGPLAAEHGGRRVEYAEISGREPRPPHDCVFSDLHDLRLARRVQLQPSPNTHRLLPEPPAAADPDAHSSGAGTDEGLSGDVVLRVRRRGGGRFRRLCVFKFKYLQ
ncbi:lactose phosphotransferase system repressor [Striga asiatica]|uniref:Lactose phosphotransferase system repressor n=1 Tax=Striga asiatica TaxID=4170 RepID=A0A5A7PMB7_STRAF|nr:lactose phosphotransferase system repressor [Striga asiatica]